MPSAAAEQDAAQHARAIRPPLATPALEQLRRLRTKRTLSAHGAGRANARSGIRRSRPASDRQGGARSVPRHALRAVRSKGLAVAADAQRLPRLARRYVVRSNESCRFDPARGKARVLSHRRQVRSIPVHHRHSRQGRPPTTSRQAVAALPMEAARSNSSAPPAARSSSTLPASIARASRSWSRARPSS